MAAGKLKFVFVISLSKFSFVRRTKGFPDTNKMAGKRKVSGRDGEVGSSASRPKSPLCVTSSYKLVLLAATSAPPASVLTRRKRRSGTGEEQLQIHTCTDARTHAPAHPRKHCPLVNCHLCKVKRGRITLASLDIS